MIRADERVARLVESALEYDERQLRMLAGESLWQAANMAAATSDYARASIYMEAAHQLFNYIHMETMLSRSWITELLKMSSHLVRLLSLRQATRQGGIPECEYPISHEDGFFTPEEAPLKLILLYRDYFQLSNSMLDLVQYYRELSSIHPRVTSFLIELDSASSYAGSDVFVGKLLRQVRANAVLLDSTMVGCLHLLDGLMHVRGGNLFEANLSFNAASRMWRASLKALKPYKFLAKAYSLLSAAEAYRSYDNYALAASLLEDAANGMERVRDRYFVSADAHVCRAYSALLKALEKEDGTAQLIESSKHLYQAHLLYKLLGDDYAIAWCCLLMDTITLSQSSPSSDSYVGSLLRSEASKYLREIMSRLPVDVDGEAALDIGGVVSALSVWDVILSHEPPRPPVLPQHFLIEPPSFLRSYLVADCYRLNDDTLMLRVANIGATPAEEIQVEGVKLSEDGKRFIVDDESRYKLADFMNSLDVQAIRLRRPEHEKTVKITYLDDMGFQRSLWLAVRPRLLVEYPATQAVAQQSINSENMIHALLDVYATT